VPSLPYPMLQMKFDCEQVPLALHAHCIEISVKMVSKREGRRNC